VGKKIASVRWPSWPGVGSLDAALIQHSLNLALRNQHPIPEADMAECAIVQPEVHSRPRNPEDFCQLGRRIMLLNHRDTLQVSPAKKTAGPISHTKSQA
jgi:cytochrome c-type biogenesis protein CcmH/NrfG